MIPEGGTGYKKPIKYRMLHVQTEGYNATATWRKTDADWKCIECDAHLSWMIKLSPLDAKLALLKADAQFQWSSIEDIKTTVESTHNVDNGRFAQPPA